MLSQRANTTLIANTANAKNPLRKVTAAASGLPLKLPPTVGGLVPVDDVTEDMNWLPHLLDAACHSCAWVPNMGLLVNPGPYGVLASQGPYMLRISLVQVVHNDAALSEGTVKMYMTPVSLNV